MKKIIDKYLQIAIAYPETLLRQPNVPANPADTTVKTLAEYQCPRWPPRHPSK